MHTIKVLTFGSRNFNTSLGELKDYLNFKLTFGDKEISKEILKNYDVLILHQDGLEEEFLKELLIDSDNIKILASHNGEKKKSKFDEVISLPIKLPDLNQIIENAVIKKNYNKNSSILIKQYKLDKNQKKLTNGDNFILLTEKEIQLLDLLLGNKKPISKNMILKEVWQYSTSADTHTVETHIYRLRKKIKDSFSDENFIMNDKDGYYL